MKVKIVTIVLLIALAGGVWWGLDIVKTGKAQQVNALTPPATAPSGTVPKLDSQGGVEVTVTWEQAKSNSDLLVFSVVMNNHEIDLSSFALKDNVGLAVNGKPVQVSTQLLSTEGEGHHVTEEIGLRSQQLNEFKPGSQITLFIKNLAGVAVRNFTWSI